MRVLSRDICSFANFIWKARIVSVGFRKPSSARCRNRLNETEIRGFQGSVINCFGGLN
jgi:hypothetical protein